MSDKQHLFAVILAGGGGTRLWPKSRNLTPKQFLKLTGKDTMVQVAGARVTQVVPWERVIVVTNKLYIDEIKKQLPQVPDDNIIAEPEKRDTALAMLVGTLYAKSKDPDAVIMNGASDHVIVDEKEFIHVMQVALQIAAEQQYLVTVGITPTRPETGFGYIKIGDSLRKIDRSLSVFRVESFTEKPNKATAQAFLSTGKYFWNAKMYVWSAHTLTEAFKKYMPEMYKLTEKLPKLDSKKFHEALVDIYKKAESISIDYAISERADNLVLIPGDFGVGVNDMIVIDTDEILLIVPKDRSQDVKKAVERLKEEGKKEYL